MRWLSKVHWFLNLFLFLTPFIAMESQFARGCNKTLSVWNDAITLSDPILWTNIWFATNACFIFLSIYLQTKTEEITMENFHSQRIGYLTKFTHLPASIQRQWFLFITLTFFRILISTNTINMCVYSLPFCYTLLATSELIIWFASV